MQIFKHSSLRQDVKASLQRLAKEEFGNIPIVANTEWSLPNWSLITFSDNEVSAFVNIVERTVHIDKKAYDAAGINNLIVNKKYRGRGLGKLIMLEAQQFILETLSCQIGILLCADNLVSFYEKLNWHLVDSHVSYKQQNTTLRWEARTMLFDPNSIVESFDHLHLNGPPW